MVHIDFKDLEGLKLHSEASANMGFTGKQVIHPGQIEIVHNSYRKVVSKYKYLALHKIVQNPRNLK